MLDLLDRLLCWVCWSWVWFLWRLSDWARVRWWHARQRLYRREALREGDRSPF